MNALAKINARVKQLAKKHPGSKRITLQKQAGAEYRAGKLGGTVGKVHKKKKAAPKKRKFKPSARRKKAGPRIAVAIAGTVSGHLHKAKSILAEQLGWAEVMVISAKTKTAKRKLSKRVAELKGKIRKIS